MLIYLLTAWLWVAVNTTRADAGIPLLAWDSALADIASTRVEEIMTPDRLSHYRADGSTSLAVQLQDRQIGFNVAGENLGRNNWPIKGTVGKLMEGFMASPAHKANVLDIAYCWIGAAIRRGAGGMYWFALIFKG